MLANISGDRIPRLLHRYSTLPDEKLDTIEDIADEALRGAVSSSAFPLVTGLAVGFGVAGFSGIPIVGAAAAGYFIYNAVNSALKKGKEAEYIKDVGILAHVLNETNLVRYAEIIGAESTITEILTAYQDGQTITPAARKLCQSLGKTPKRRSITTFLEEIQQLQTLPEPAQLPSTPTSAIAPSIAGGTCKILTAVDDLVNPVRSSYISAPPRTGKGILIALAMRQFKQRYPNGMLYSYTPKQDPKEHWYWESSNQHFNPDLDQHPTRAAQSLYAMIRHWQSLPSTPESPILFVCDDTRSFSARLLDFLIHEASMRQSVDRFVWVLTPLCTVQESGVSASALKSLRNYTLASRENLKFADGGTAAFAAPKISTNHPLLAHYQTIAYSHDSHTWLPIPTLAQPTVDQFAHSNPTLNHWGNLPIVDSGHPWTFNAPVTEVFTRAYAQSFMDITDPTIALIHSEPDPNKREALTIAYQWAIARQDNGATITRPDFINRAKNDRKSTYLRDNRDEIWEDLQRLIC